MRIAKTTAALAFTALAAFTAGCSEQKKEEKASAPAPASAQPNQEGTSGSSGATAPATAPKATAPEEKK